MSENPTRGIGAYCRYSDAHFVNPLPHVIGCDWFARNGTRLQDVKNVVDGVLLGNAGFVDYTEKKQQKNYSLDHGFPSPLSALEILSSISSSAGNWSILFTRIKFMTPANFVKAID